MDLLERDRPLGTLHALRRESVAEGGRLVVVEGEAGIGKTSLLRAFRCSIPAGSRTVFGVCDPMSTPEPLGPIVDIARRLDYVGPTIVIVNGPGPTPSFGPRSVL